jgi:hypothetical protein
VSAPRRCGRRNERRPALKVCVSPDRPRRFGSRGPAFAAEQNRRPVLARGPPLVEVETAPRGRRSVLLRCEGRRLLADPQQFISPQTRQRRLIGSLRVPTTVAAG